MAQFFENIEGQLKFIVLHKLTIADQKRCTLLLVARRQSMSRTLKQCFGNLPALDHLSVWHSVSLTAMRLIWCTRGTACMQCSMAAMGHTRKNSG
jgi:hypothetical protein